MSITRTRRSIIGVSIAATLTLAACAAPTDSQAPEETAAPVTTEAPATTQAPVETAPPTTEPAPVAEVLALGEYADVGDWNLTVTSIVRDDQVESYSPEPGVEYAGFRLTVTGTYSGEEEGDMFWDVTIKYVGTDNRVYNDFDSYNTDFNAISMAPSVVAGGTQTIEMTLAIPVDALGSETFRVENLFDFGDNGVKFAWDS